MKANIGINEKSEAILKWPKSSKNVSKSAIDHRRSHTRYWSRFWNAWNTAHFIPQRKTAHTIAIITGDSWFNMKIV